MTDSAPTSGASAGGSAADDAPWRAFDHLDLDGAAARIAGRVERTPLVRLPTDDPGLDLRGKMENRQVTGSFKARGALSNVLCLTDEERARGVVASSSGNHGRALAWAAEQAGVAATIVMPADAYPNKIEACRAEGAEVLLAPDRLAADRITAELAAEGRVLIHPYDRVGTIEGASTVGREIAEDWPEVDVVVLCVGGGGLSAGASLALRRALGRGVRLFGAEPSGAPTMTVGLRERRSTPLDEITSEVQGLTTPFAGQHNIDVNLTTLDGVLLVDDGAIFEAQRRLVNDGDLGARHGRWTGEVVEPAGAAAYAAVVQGALDAALPGRPVGRPLRVAVTVSGGNPDPAQLAALRRAPRGAAREAGR